MLPSPQEPPFCRAERSIRVGVIAGPLKFVKDFSLPGTARYFRRRELLDGAATCGAYR
jgi:hypothetical protein